MAEIRPFHGLRFGAIAGDLAELVAPPYDVLSQEQRDALAARNAHNVVLLTLPEQNADDRSKFVKYTRSAARLEQWKSDGNLEKEPTPAYYRYIQTFSIPGSDERFDRISLITTIKTEPYEKGVVLPHEQTFPKHKEDRLRILEATRAHLECIYGLFEDPDSAVFELIRSAPGERVADVTTDDGVRHIVEVISDPAALKAITDGVGPKKVWIADGHHRYETACTFRESLGARDGLVPEDFMMMALSSISDPGLVLLPTHRILKNMPFDQADLKSRLGSHFTITECPNTLLIETLEAEQKPGESIFGVALPGGTGWVLKAPAPAAGADAAARLKNLDVSVLHEKIFTELLGFQGIEFFDYTRDPQEAIDAVSDYSPASFLMIPPTVEDMQEIAVGGLKMPQKSTFYYPKILSGLVLWSLNDYA